MADELADGDACPACENKHPDEEPGTLHAFEEQTAIYQRMSCDECGSIFDENGTCVMNNLRLGPPPWIDRHGEVDPIRLQQARIDDEGPGRSFPDEWYGKSNRLL